MRNLQNYKNTPLSRFFPSPVVDTDQQNLLPSCNLPTKHILQNYPTHSFGILSTLTSSDEQRDKLSPSSKLKELKNYTILDNNNRNTDGTHIIHKILPVRNLQNYKNTPLSRFFPSPVVDTDQQNLLPSCNLPTKHILQNSPTNSFGILSTLTSSDEQRDSYSISQNNSQTRSFRM